MPRDGAITLGEWLSVIIISVGVVATGIVLAWVVARSEMRRLKGAKMPSVMPHAYRRDAIRRGCSLR